MRIANGSGVSVTDVNQLLERFFQAQKMMSQMAGSMGLPGMGPMSKKARGRQMQAQSKKGKKGKGRPKAAARPAAMGAPGCAAGPCPAGCPACPAASVSGRPARPQAELRPVQGRPARPVTPLHLSGVVLPEGEHRDVWVRDGRFTFEPVPGAETVSRGGWLLPGLVDAHCHVGIGAGGGAVEDDAEAAGARRAGRRRAGAARLRLAGRHPLPGRPRRPAADHPRRPAHRPPRAATSPAWASRWSRPTWSAEVGRQARRGDGWVKLVGDWIDRDVGDLAPVWPADVAGRGDRRRARGGRPGHGAHVRHRRAARADRRPGIDCIEHGTGLTEELIAEMAARRHRRGPDADQRRELPGVRRGGGGEVPRLRRAHAAAVRAVRRRVRAAFEAGVAGASPAPTPAAASSTA